jgi:hypothetical protein
LRFITQFLALDKYRFYLFSPFSGEEKRKRKLKIESQRNLKGSNGLKFIKFTHLIEFGIPKRFCPFKSEKFFVRPSSTFHKSIIHFRLISEVIKEHKQKFLGSEIELSSGMKRDGIFEVDRKKGWEGGILMREGEDNEKEQRWK